MKSGREKQKSKKNKFSIFAKANIFLSLIVSIAFGYEVGFFIRNWDWFTLIICLMCFLAVNYSTYLNLTKELSIQYMKGSTEEMKRSYEILSKIKEVNENVYLSESIREKIKEKYEE